MSHLELDAADFWFHCPALPAGALRVLRFTGREALSQPLSFTIELVSAEPDLELLAALGQPAQLGLRGRRPDGSRYTRTFHGVVARAMQLAAGVRLSRYQLTLICRLGALGYGSDLRIFQDLSAPEVVLAVLGEAAPADSIRPLLHDRYPRRDFCVQYKESRLQFIRRLLEHEGICFFADPDREMVYLADGPHAFEALSVHPRLRHRDAPPRYEEGLWTLQEDCVLCPDEAVLREFPVAQPRLDLEARARTDRGSYVEYDFPDGYGQPAEGERLARIRLQEQLCARKRYGARSNVPELAPGLKFVLEGHRRRSCNREYLIVAVEHCGVQPQALPAGGELEALGISVPSPGPDRLCYHNRVTCQPADLAFRPARTSPRPQLGGAQTAIVVGPPGKEIHCDELGRVKLQFPWDRRSQRNDDSSGWVRVSQPWSGPDCGEIFLPRVGQQVVVVFQDGDPDRPLIVGRVAEGENLPPYELPAAKTISPLPSASTPGACGHNELRCDDPKGRAQPHPRAERELSVVVGRDHSRRGAADERGSEDGSRSVIVPGNLRTVVRTGDHTLRVENGSSQTEVKGSCTTTVQSGNSELWVLSGGHITKAAGPVTIASGRGRLNLLAAGPWHARSKQQAVLAAPEITLQAGRKLTLAVGPSTITLDESGIELAGPQLTSRALFTNAMSGAS